MDWLDLLALQGTLKSLFQHHSSKASILRCSAFFTAQLSHPYMTTGKTTALTRPTPVLLPGKSHGWRSLVGYSPWGRKESDTTKWLHFLSFFSLTRWTFVSKIMSLLFNILSRLVMTVLPRSKCLLISWLQSPFAVILEPPKTKSVTVSIVFPSMCHEVIGPDAMILVFWMLSFKPTFSLSSFTFIKRLFSSSLLSAVRVVSSAYLRLLILLSAILILDCTSSSQAFHMMYSAYKLNKQGDDIQPLHTPFLIWNQSVVPCPVLTVASFPAYRFLRRQVRWSGIPISFRIFHSLLWFTQSKALA